MRRFSFLLLAALIMFVSCKKSEKEAIVRLHVNNFEVTQDDISTRDEVPIASVTNIEAVTLAFYTDAGAEQYKVTQLKDDATTYTTFGDFECSLPMGSYTMVVLGYKTKEGSPFVLTGPTQASFTGNYAYETFVNTQAVNITNTSAVTLTATLNRIVTMLQVVSTDNRPEEAASIRMTVSAGSKSFNPTTGLATDDLGFNNTVAFSGAAGSTSNNGAYFFLATDEETMDVTIDILNASGSSISHKFISDVSFKRNRRSILTGSLYDAGAGSDFTVETDWLPDLNIGF